MDVIIVEVNGPVVFGCNPRSNSLAMPRMRGAKPEGGVVESRAVCVTGTIRDVPAADIRAEIQI
jgi:hypothetical protein